MKMEDVKPGGVYACKVSGKVVPIWILSWHPHLRGWRAKNLITRKSIWIKSAARLRYPMVWSKPLQRYVAYLWSTGGKP